MNDAKTWVGIFHCQPLFFGTFKRLIKRIAFYSLIKGSNSMSLLLSAFFRSPFFLFTRFIFSFQCVTFFLLSSFHFSRSMICCGGITLHSHYKMNIFLISMLALCLCVYNDKKASFIGNKKTRFCARSHRSSKTTQRIFVHVCVCLCLCCCCCSCMRGCFLKGGLLAVKRCVLLQFNPIILMNGYGKYILLHVLW